MIPQSMDFYLKGQDEIRSNITCFYTQMLSIVGYFYSFALWGTATQLPNIYMETSSFIIHAQPQLDLFLSIFS